MPKAKPSPDPKRFLCLCDNSNQTCTSPYCQNKQTKSLHTKLLHLAIMADNLQENVEPKVLMAKILAAVSVAFTVGLLFGLTL
jgi:hypothetical protein